MRDLDTINPKVLKPSILASISTAMLSLFVLISIPLAHGAAPGIPLSDNLVFLLMCFVLGLSLMAAIFSVIFRWGWKAKYYGVSAFCVTGISFMAIIPCLAAVLYGRAPYWAKTVIVLFYVISHLLWCRRFAKIYKNIFREEALQAVLFEEDVDAVYYMRRADNFLLEKHFKFSQTPRDSAFLLFMGLAFLMIPVMEAARDFIGVPFVHIFLIVAMVPVSWLSIGLAFRVYLIFYYYPDKIKKTTGKDVYVDLGSKHRPSSAQRGRK